MRKYTKKHVNLEFEKLKETLGVNLDLFYDRSSHKGYLLTIHSKEQDVVLYPFGTDWLLTDEMYYGLKFANTALEIKNEKKPKKKTKE